MPKKEKRDVRLEILQALRDEPDLTPAQLGRLLGIGPRSVSAALTDLVKISNALPRPILRCVLVKEDGELHARWSVVQPEPAPKEPAAA